MPIVRAITDLVPYPAKEPRGSPSVRPKSDPPAGCRRFVTARWWMAGRYRDGGPPFIKGVRTPGGINSVKWKWKMEIIGGTELARSCGESAIRCRSGFLGGEITHRAVCSALIMQSEFEHYRIESLVQEGRYLTWYSNYNTASSQTISTSNWSTLFLNTCCLLKLFGWNQVGDFLRSLEVGRVLNFGLSKLLRQD